MARGEEVSGLLHISDRLFTAALARASSARNSSGLTSDIRIGQGVKTRRAFCTSETDCLLANCRVWKQPEEPFTPCPM